MSKFDKLLQRIKNLDKGMRFDEVKKVLLSYGYTMKFPHGGSSHATFRKDNHSYSRAYQAHIHYVGQRNHRKD